MPAAYCVEPTRKLIYIRAWGVLRLTDLHALRAVLTAHPNFDPHFTLVAELVDADLAQLRSADIVSLATSRAFAPDARRAIVATDPALFGMARMFQAHRELAMASAEVFVSRTLGDALKWAGATDFIPTALTEVEPVT